MRRGSCNYEYFYESQCHGTVERRKHTWKYFVWQIKVICSFWFSPHPSLRRGSASLDQYLPCLFGLWYPYIHLNIVPSSPRSIQLFRRKQTQMRSNPPSRAHIFPIVEKVKAVWMALTGTEQGIELAWWSRSDPDCLFYSVPLDKLTAKLNWPKSYFVPKICLGILLVWPNVTVTFVMQYTETVECRLAHVCNPDEWNVLKCFLYYFASYCG